jgi:hypothetical protein
LDGTRAAVVNQKSAVTLRLAVLGAFALKPPPENTRQP